MNAGKTDKYEQPKTVTIQFLKFVLIGVMNTLIDLGIYTLLTAVIGVPLIPANIVSYTCGVLNSYFWNSRWTFKQTQKRTVLTFVLFIIVNLVSLGVSTLVLSLCNQNIHIANEFWQLIVCKVIATACSLIVNFIGNKLIVFRQKNDSQGNA